MAELEDAPWIKKPEAKEPGKTEGLPDAPWLGNSVDTATDIVKTAGPSIVRGTLGALTTPRALSDLAGAGVNYLANKGPQSVADAANKFHNWDSGIGQAFPSYEQLKGETEDALGHPLYDAKTGVGKGVQTGIEIAPSLLSGGEGVVPTVGRSIGAGTLSGLMGSGADYLKSKFPSMPDWVPGVARGAGAVVGGAVAPRAVTPLPMTDARLAEVNALRQTNPELVNASTAGQLADAPRMMGLEARSPRTAGVPAAQEQAYTQGVMRQAGADGHMANDAGFAAARQGGDAIRTLQNMHSMTPAEFALMNRDVGAMGRPGSPLFRAVGPSQPFQEVRDTIRQGPMGPTGPTPLNMTGERYGALKQIIQNAGSASPTSHEAQAIFAARERMKQAFRNSMPPDEAARLQQLDQQYSNYKTIEGIKPKAGEETLTPNQVASRADRGSDLKEHADQAAHVMTPHPAPKDDASNFARVLTTLGGAAVGASSGEGIRGAIRGAMEGSLPGLFVGPSAVGAVKNAAGRVAASPPVQTWAKNQAWRPQGLVTEAPNREALVRALMAPQSSGR